MHMTGVFAVRPGTNTHFGRGYGRRAAALALGAVLLIAAVAGLHALHRAGNEAGERVTWPALLLVGLTALGGGIKLAEWGLKPVLDAIFTVTTARVPEAAQAVIATAGVVGGGLGMWWSFRGGDSQWWQHISGEQGWTLVLGVGQMLVAVLAGGLLFSGGKYLFGLLAEILAGAGLAGTRDRVNHAGAQNDSSNVGRYLSSSHPALLAALIAGGLGLVVLVGWLTPALAACITGASVLAAAAAIAVVLVWAVGANLGWWHGLAGLYAWATDASRKAAATAGVVALLVFSGGALGLGWVSPATVPVALADCPPDCGGGSNGAGSYGPDASQFQPPSMPNQAPDYQSGANAGYQSPDQANGVSIYNQSQASSAGNTSGYPQEKPYYGNADSQGNALSQPDTGPSPMTGQPGQPRMANPDYQGGQSNPATNPGTQRANQGAQPNQSAPQQQPTNQGQQPNQPQQSDQQRVDDLARQLQQQQQQSRQDRQRIDDLTKQLQKQHDKQQVPKLPPSKDNNDRDKQQNRDGNDDQSGNTDLAALMMGAASATRRRKQDQQQGPDTQALGQDAAAAATGLPGDIQTYTQSGQAIAQSSGRAAQGFSSAAEAGASIASSAQLGAVNPEDAITLVQGISQGIQGTADAINDGSQIVKIAQGEADQAAQGIGDADPQLRPQMRQFTQFNDQLSQVTGWVGQGSQLASQTAGAVNTVSGLGTGGLPDIAGGDLADESTDVSQDATMLSGAAPAAFDLNSDTEAEVDVSKVLAHSGTPMRQTSAPPPPPSNGTLDTRPAGMGGSMSGPSPTPTAGSTSPMDSYGDHQPPATPPTQQSENNNQPLQPSEILDPLSDQADTDFAFGTAVVGFLEEEAEEAENASWTARLGSFFRTVGGRWFVLGAIITGLDDFTDWAEGKKTGGAALGHFLGSVAGGFLGGLAGGLAGLYALGAVGGYFGGPPGVVIGAALGTILGGGFGAYYGTKQGGSWGEKAGEWIQSLLD